jgi:FkbM family methyltransferase
MFSGEAGTLPAAMERSWIDRLKVVMSRNRPRHKPQLWEDFALSVRRRVELELHRRMRTDWMDTPHVVDLSRVRIDDGGPPIRMSLVLRDAIAKAVFLYGTYEICGTRLMQAFLRPGMTFVDVGANIGYYTLLAARAVGATGAVYAFEPNAPVRARLEENLRLNGLLGGDRDRIHVRPHAVARVSGEIQFYRSTVSDNSGLSSILPGAGRADDAEVVPCVSLDDFAAALPDGKPIHLMKIDVEGAEMEVLGGGGGVLSRADGPAIIFESSEIATSGAFLTPYGYSIRRVHYTMAGGLQLLALGAPFHGIFDDYEPPSYFAAKNMAAFDQIVAQANTRQPAALRMLGRL